MQTMEQDPCSTLKDLPHLLKILKPFPEITQHIIVYGSHYQLIISMEILIISQSMPSFLVVDSELYLGGACGRAASVAWNPLLNSV